MAKKDIKVDYDKEEDMIHLFREGSKIKFSFDVELPQGDIVIDFDFNGHIVGLEFFKVSNYFPFLKKIKKDKIKAKMNVQYGRNWAQIYYEIHVPGRKPVLNTLISPYNKELVITH